MEGISSVNSSDGVEDDASTRPGSSRLSLGSSPSELSDDDGNTGMNEGPDDDFALDDGEGSLTPTEKIVMDEDDNDQLPVAQPPPRPPLSPSHDRQAAVTTVTTGDDNAVFDDGLFEDSSDTLSNAPMDMDDRDDEDDEEEPLLSSLSLTGDNAPLSPDPEQEHESKEEEEEDEEDENEQQQKGELDTTVAKEEKQQQQANGIVNESQEDIHMKDEDGDGEKAQTKSTMSPVEESSAAAAAAATTSSSTTTTAAAAAEPSSSNSTPPSPASMLPGDKNENQQQTKISDNDNDTSPTPQSPMTPSSRKRRGSQTLEDEEWQQRRSSKIMELKEQQNGSDHVPEGSQLPSSSEAEPKEEPNQEQEDKPEKDEGKRVNLLCWSSFFFYLQSFSLQRKMAVIKNTSNGTRKLWMH